MDRETLFSHLNRRYCSKREMLSRIPLGVQPDALWQELLNSRRAKSTALPLYTPNGSPYWYVTTDRMIAASEKIVETLYTDGADFDPFTEPPPVVTLEESFFTSYIEGAQITMQAAMDFLSSGEPPRDIEEQMITNNRMAGRFAAENLFRGIDEEFLRGLAYILTDGMDNGGQEYRTTDDVDFVTADGDRLIFPDARFVPDRIGELCAYLASPQSHPLIKAGVAQGYMQILRPFPEGNDRIGRILSNIILLRAGYTFFSDVSLSALIARKSYAYYEAAAGILREENGGDMTYFLEFFLELLSRAVDERALRQRRKEEQNLQTEQDMARTALTVPSEPPPVSFRDESERKAEEPEQPISAVEEAIEKEGDLLDGFFTVPAQEPDVKSCGIIIRTKETSVDRIRELLTRLYDESPGEQVKACAKLFLDFVSQGKYVFTNAEVADGCCITSQQAANMICQYKLKGIVVSCETLDNRHMLYRFNIHDAALPPQRKDTRIEEENQANLTTVNHVLTEAMTDLWFGENVGLLRVWDSLNLIISGRSGVMKKNALLFLNYLGQGKHQFTRADIMEAIGCTKKQAENVMMRFKTKQIIEKSNAKIGPYWIYHFNESLPPLTQDDYGCEVVEAIDALRYSTVSKKDQRIGMALLSCLPQGFITVRDYAEYADAEKMTEDMQLAEWMGIVERLSPYVYRINRHRAQQQPKLTDKQKNLMTLLYLQFEGNWFSTQDAHSATARTKSSISNLLHRLVHLHAVERTERSIYKYFRILVDPMDCPCFFDMESGGSVDLLIKDEQRIKCPAPEPSECPEPEPPEITDEPYSDEFYAVLDRLDSSECASDNRLSEMLRRNMKKGYISKDDYSEHGYSSSVWFKDMELAMVLGLVFVGKRGFRTMNKTLESRRSYMQPNLKKAVTEIYEAFGDQIFTSEMFIATVKYSETHSYASLRKLALMSVVDLQKTEGGNQYHLLVNPEDNPECFDAAA